MFNIKKSDLIPSKLGAASLLVISASFLVLLNIESVLAFLADDPTQDFDKDLFPVIQTFLSEKLTILTADTATFIFWLGIGILALALIELAHWLLHFFKVDLPTLEIFRPQIQGYHFSDILTRMAVRSVALFALIFWAFSFFLIVLPELSSLFNRGLELGIGLLLTIVAVILLAGYLYLGILFLQFLALRHRLL